SAVQSRVKRPEETDGQRSRRRIGFTHGRWVALLFSACGKILGCMSEILGSCPHHGPHGSSRVEPSDEGATRDGSLPRTGGKSLASLVAPRRSRRGEEMTAKMSCSRDIRTGQNSGGAVRHGARSGAAAAVAVAWALSALPAARAASWQVT